MKTIKSLIILGIIPALFFACRINAMSGALDTTFGNDGETLTPMSRADILKGIGIMTSTNNITIAGITQTTAPTAFVAQYTSSGSLNTSGFNSSGSTPGYQILLPSGITQSGANCVTVAPTGGGTGSGDIYIAGSAIQSSSTNFFIARYTPAGVLDTTFNSPNGWLTTSIGNGASAHAIGTQTTGPRPVIGGCSIQNGNPVFTLASYSTAGVLYTSFGTNGVTITALGNISIIRALAIVPSTLGGATLNDIVVAGIVDNQLTVARYTAAGILDTTFSSPNGYFTPSIAGASSSQAYAVAIDPTTNNTYVAGSAMISGVNYALIMRFTPTGALDTTFNSTGYVLQSILYGAEYYSVAVQSNELIVVGGYATGVLSNEICMDVP